MEAQSPGRDDSAVAGRVARLAGNDAGRRRRLDGLLASFDPLFDWRLLVGHRTVSGTWLSDESLRTQYVHLTDNLVGTVIDDEHDLMLYLDKSARPVAWLTNSLWDVLSPCLDQDGQIAARPSRPAIRFLNIDRLQWRDAIDPNDTGAVDIDRLPDEITRDLRRTLLVNPNHRTLSDGELMTAPTFLSGRSVLVIDEVRVGGSTVEIACALLAAAIPEATFVGVQWMRPNLVTGKDGNRRNNQLPVWYRHDTALGRGIGDRDPDRASTAAEWRTRVGRHFLSRPHDPSVDDAAGRQLRLEMRQLAAAALAGEVKVIPSFDREDCEQRARFFTGMSLDELRSWREAAGIHLYPR